MEMCLPSCVCACVCACECEYVFVSLCKMLRGVRGALCRCVRENVFALMCVCVCVIVCVCVCV